jgi:hypothetical protein
MRHTKSDRHDRTLVTYIPFNAKAKKGGPAVRVMLFPTHSAFRAANDDGVPDAMACFVYDRDECGRSGIVGTLSFSRENLSLGTISHECLHATLELERILSGTERIVIEDEEPATVRFQRGENAMLLHSADSGVEETLAHALGDLIDGVSDWLKAHGGGFR